jgi:hypothetical protein
VPAPTTRLLRRFLIGQAVALALFAFVPSGGWLHAAWQTLMGWASAGFVVVAARRYHPQVALAWYVMAAGMFVSAAGTTVEMIVWRGWGVTTNPNAADACWLALFPALLIGLGLLVHRQAIVEDLGAMLLHTAVCALLNLFVGIFAWEIIVWRTPSDHSLTLANRLVVTIYPLADLMVLALLLRLWLGTGWRSPPVALLFAGMCGFLAADIGWVGFLRSGAMPERLTQYLMEVTSVGSRALLAASALHPAMRDIAPSAEARAERLGALGWLGLSASVLTAPLVIIVQALLDRLYSVTSL